jgi:Fe-Mn family superoxide dismutase
MAFKVPDLPYDFNALEPNIDGKTMMIHHDKHHAAYVANLNKALEGHPELQDKSALELILELDAITEDIRLAVRNNGGGHVNHTLFWTIMSPDGGGAPSGALGSAIDDTFGSFDDFKAEFKNAGMTQFGSGWAWLCVDGDGNLVVTKTPNQDSPLYTDGMIPILGLDVWEHAYYLNYQNRRPDYIDAWWNTVDWDRVGKYYKLIKFEEGIMGLADWAASQWGKFEDALKKLTE